MGLGRLPSTKPPGAARTSRTRSVMVGAKSSFFRVRVRARTRVRARVRARARVRGRS